MASLLFRIGRIGRWRLAAAVLAAAFVLASAWAAFEVTLAQALRSAGEGAERRLQLFDRTLEAIIERFHYLPSSIALAPEMIAALEAPADPARRDSANGFLSRLNDTAGSSELFIMSFEGRVVAASNWWAYDSFVGEDLSYRPYFEEAMADGEARFYAVGTVTGVAGYFLARRIEGPEGPIGVAVAKVNLGEIEANWWRSGELIGIADLNDIVILSTRPDWRYRPVSPLAPGEAFRFAPERRYGPQGARPEPIAADVWPSRGVTFAFIAGGGGGGPDGLYLLDEVRLPVHQWRILSFTPTGPLFRSAWISAAAAGLGAGALVLVLILVHQRRRLIAQRLADHERLEQRVAERTEDLYVTNEALRAEIDERIRAEAAERETQAHLVQAAKLASLGQALAGVAHEMSQPVAALTTHLASARLVAAQRGDAEIGPMLVNMDRIVDRLAALTGHLKTFARTQTGAPPEAEIGATIVNALDLVNHRLRELGIKTRLEQPDRPISVKANPVHVEQVLINLFSNAADAMAGSDHRLLSITVSEAAGHVEIAVGDTGEGIAPEALPNIFDPFYSTKGPGEGLGLGLSISYGLVRDMGGAITVESAQGTGARFAVTLPLPATAPIFKGTELA